MQEETKVHIFWTGGMDSTFAVVQLLMTTESLVQPHYIVRYEDSTGIEIDTMIRIRRKICREFPDLRPRFLPTVYTNVDLIPEFDDIKDDVDNLKKKMKIVAQYQLMANYCVANNIEKIEVALTNEMESFEQFRASSAFKSFVYPIIDITKPQLYKIAKENNWNHFLDMTSTCRRPKKKIKACGMCTTCVDMVIQDMGFTLPLISRIKANIQAPLRKYWRGNYTKKKDTKLFQLIERKFEHKL